MADVTLKTARGAHISQSEVADLITDMAAKAAAADLATLSASVQALDGTVSANTAALAGKIGTDQLGASGGVATLDTQGTIPLAQVPAGVGSGIEVGGHMDWSGPRLPANGKFKYRNGDAISRTTYADCFDALCPEFTGDTTSGSAVISNIDDMAGMQVGQIIEGSGIPSGAVISSLDTGADTITLDQNATATATTVNLRFFTYGAGDGSTTFNLPDARGRVDAGRDDMGGTAANRILAADGSTTNPDGAKLGDAGGASRQNFSGFMGAASGAAATYGRTYDGVDVVSGAGNVSNMQSTIIVNKLIKVLP